MGEAYSFVAVLHGQLQWEGHCDGVPPSSLGLKPSEQTYGSQFHLQGALLTAQLQQWLMLQEMAYAANPGKIPSQGHKIVCNLIHNIASK